MQLFETMKIKNGQIPRVKYHTKRLKLSAQKLNFQFGEQEWHKIINEMTSKYRIGEYRLKVTLNAQGDFETIVSELPKKNTFTAKIQTLQNSVEPIFLNNKTTERKHLDHQHETDLILLTSPNGKVLEFDIGNIVIEENGKWYTPKYDGDFLKGCMRTYLIEQNKLTEKDFDKNELIVKYRNDEIRLFLINSLREVAVVHLCL
ncbi:aminodeoxychorismate lyase [Staphylococcus schweitzeri]|uniref:Aminodeoxychorismate lyase n=1 Tax=Staphylococcus schweitzeri TaxID=1654388 RepID=A0A2K4AKV4_9STAP|nr:aminotransferase class IV [Staphylococcus schweitzeri]MBE2129154.1 aminotransferase class IV [Staphylococcus schweitzeri]PNZ50374.1 aminodeoxychorismate lyase [Staphylococcus schweitzeri]CDR51573.1 putative para-aminobenzoate synthetase component [Staphylococcus schweitzeri]CDR54733.1 putative para-aminobenzoate synthetase component [Staphylococcus schweitzeri]CDR60472.1 putative para-aminobenzoate synthetase component [Staphylococcus schweitzeri]